MDVYATMQVTFEVAAYCRGHKYTPEAVGLARAIRAYDAALEGLRNAEIVLATAEANIATANEAARIRMEADKHA